MSIVKEHDMARAAVFLDIHRVATEERRKACIGDQDSVIMQMLREQAANEAQHIIAQALTQSEVIREVAKSDGHREGYDSGFTQGLADAEQRYQDQLNQYHMQFREELREVTEWIEEERLTYWAEAEAQILGLVKECVRRVVKDETETNPAVVISVVKNALRRVNSSERIRIRVNEEDLPNVRELREELLMVVDTVRPPEIIADRRVGQGGCVVDTDSVTIDARLSAQIDAVEAALDIAEDQAA